MSVIGKAEIKKKADGFVQNVMNILKQKMICTNIDTNYII